MAEHRTPDEPDDPDAPEGEDGVEAYESDWYRSLQAVANREGDKTPGKGGEPEKDDASEDDEKDSAKGDEHDGKTKKSHPEPGEPGIWVVVTPDR